MGLHEEQEVYCRLMPKPLHRLPLDDWFDDPPHPYDSWPVAKDLDLDEHIPYP